MSLSATVLGNRRLTTVGEWQAAIRAIGFDLVLDSEADRRVDDLGGHLPAHREGQEAGFECCPVGTDDAAETVEMDPDTDFGGPWTCALDFRFVGFANACGVNIAGAAYAHVTGGIFYEGEGGDLYDAQAAIAFARTTEIETRRYIAQSEA